MQLPYTLYRCPCAKYTTADGPDHRVVPTDDGGGESDEQEKSFDPTSPSSAFSLYPLEHLMWCDECHDVRCPSCTVEEIVAWFCPNCLFEASSSMVKSEGNRCTRNCFNCPSCTAPLSVIALDADTGGSAGPWILACEHCNWTTLDVGIEFEKPVSLFSQFAKMDPIWASRASSQLSSRAEGNSNVGAGQDADARFATLRSFYSSQLSKGNLSNHFSSPQGDLNYSSPSSLARIMSLYTGSSKLGKKSSAKSSLMHEAADSADGLLLASSAADADVVEKLRNHGWHATTSIEQRSEQPNEPLFLSSLRPIPTLLRTKRSKRCRTCRHILVKPDPRIQNLRYRIKLVALNYVPHISVKPMATSPGTKCLDLAALPATRPLQFLLTLQNPMFDPVKVALATQPVTSGRFGSRVTILCPQFGIGANADVWDEALEGDGKRGSGERARVPDEKPENRVAEAGKVWSKGRNWTTVVVEVACARVDQSAADLEEDECVLQIPVFVRVEYDAETGAEDGGASEARRERRERREFGFWAVLGIGTLEIP